MPEYPKPAGWQGGSDDWSMVRTFDGHIEFSPYDDDEDTSDIDCRRNARHSSNVHIGGSY